MGDRYLSLREVSEVNAHSISNKYSHSISYFDTSSVVRGHFSNPIVYATLHDAPSRARRRAVAGDTLISTVRPNMKHFGFLTDVMDDAVYSTGFAVLHPDSSKVLPYYCYLLVTTDSATSKLQQIGETATTTYPSVRPSDILNLQVYIPDLEYQQKVIDIISAFDLKIELNQQINNNLLKVIDAMFNRVYLGNGQVRAASRLKLSSIIRTKSGTFNPKKTTETFVNHFSMPAFDAARFPVVDAASDIKSNKNVVEPFSILVSKMNPDVKRVWLPNTSDELLNVASTEFLTFNADVPEMQAFVYSVVNNKRYQKYLETNTTGSTNSRQRVLPKVAYAYEIPYNKEAARQFGFQTVDIINMIKLNKEQNQYLTRLRNILLPKLLAGDIDLSNIETVMNNA